jgi:glycine/D-amino acid oxidase-like deaminating enzyme
VTSEAPDSHTVHTPRGSIRTKKVVYATNAYTFGLLPEYRESIVPCRGICCHIALPEGQEPPFVSYTYILGTEDRNGSSYLISRPDRTIIVGGAQKSFKGFRNQWYNVVDDSTLIEPARSYYDGYMQRTFRGWDTTDAHVKEIWTGSMSPLFRAWIFKEYPLVDIGTILMNCELTFFLNSNGLLL